MLHRIRLVPHRLIVLVLALMACGRDNPAAPDAATHFDASRARADALAMSGVLGSGVVESFTAMTGRLGLGVGATAAAGAASDALLAARNTSPAAMREAAATLAGRLLSVADPDVVLAAPAIRPAALGTTFVYDPVQGRYVPAPERTGAPADGVRFILYAVNPVTGEPVVDTEIGYADLHDIGGADPSGIALRLEVVAEGVTYLDYSVAIRGAEGAGALTVAGFLTDGTTRLDFQIEARGTMGRDASVHEVRFRFEVPARSFVVVGSVRGISSPAGGRQQVQLVVNTGGAVIRYEILADDRTVNATVFVNDQIFATITGDHRHPDVRGAGGRALTEDEAQALRQLLGLAEGAFHLFARLLQPIAVILALSTVP